MGGCIPHSFQLCVLRGCSFQDSMCCVPRPGGGGPGIIPAPFQGLPRLVSSLLGQGVVVRVAVRFGWSRSRRFPGCLRLIFPLPLVHLGCLREVCCLLVASRLKCGLASLGRQLSWWQAPVQVLPAVISAVKSFTFYYYYYFYFSAARSVSGFLEVLVLPVLLSGFLGCLAFHHGGQSVPLGPQ